MSGPPGAYAVWPARPAAPAGRPSLLRLPGVGPRAEARPLTRQAITACLGDWLGHPADLHETGCGPRPAPGPAAGFAIGLSYDETDAWVAFHRGKVALDASRIREFPERAGVAALYLGRTEEMSPAEFALRWTRLEATLKYRGEALTEGARPAEAPHVCGWIEAGVALTLAWA